MEIIKTAQAGTFESSDILVLVQPGDGKKTVELDSTVLLQYKESILAEINNALEKYEVDDIHLIAKDKGALNATIKARVETVIMRGAGIQEGTSYVSK